MHTRLRAVLAASLIGSGGAVSLALPGPVAQAVATTVDLVGPAGSGRFGHRALVLTNGNLVVVDDRFDANGKTDIGAVYLYNGTTHALISTLTGTNTDDQIGSNGVYEVGNSNFVVASPLWRKPGLLQVGAATWVDGAAGLNGEVAAANSLTGVSEGDHVGEDIDVLTNGNYVISAPNFDRGAIPSAGMVRWANGNTPITGTPNFLNSFLGGNPNDFVGLAAVTPLANGNYTIETPTWDNGAIEDAGAVTWADGTVGIKGEIDVANSIVGSHEDDSVGSGDSNGSRGVIPLSDGDYVISSPRWDSANGLVEDVGAATWASGAGPSAGVIQNSNSLIGTTAFDRVSNDGVFALTNGNYVVASGQWNLGNFVDDAGAVTWGNGVNGTDGTVDASNSLVGEHDQDNIGRSLALPLEAVTPLANGHYVIVSPDWDKGAIQDVGAVTWANGAGGTVGLLQAAASLTGSVTGDAVGRGGVTALIGGSYVVKSPNWNNGPKIKVGAATFSLGNGATVGVVGAGNSLIGSASDDRVGSGGVAALKNGKYVVGSPGWDNGGVVDAGASTLGAATGTAGPVSAANSLFGAHTGDRVGASIVALPLTGNYVTVSPDYGNNGSAKAGAATFASGATGLVAAVSSSNSLVGGLPNDALGDAGVVVMPDNRYVVISRHLDHNGVVDAGAVTVGSPIGVVGQPSAANSVFGSVADGVLGVAKRYLADGSVVVQRPASNIVTLLNFPPDPNDPNNPGPNDPGDPNDPDGPSLDYISVAPARLVDTRPAAQTVDGAGAGTGIVVGGSTFEVVVTGRGGVPNGVPAVALNVTVTEAAAPGFLTAFPCAQPQPTASNLNFEAGSTIPNAVISKVGDGGKVCLFASQNVQLVVDVNGYFPPTTSFVSLNPARVLDTRPGADHPTVDGLQQNTGIVPANSVTTVQITGRAAVPADAVAVALNVTVTEPDAPGFVSVFPCGAQPPTASNLNHVAGQSIPNLVIAKIGDGGGICLFNQSTTHLVVDVGGFFPSNTTYAALNPARLLDTRAGAATIDGQGAGAGAQPLGTVTVVRVAGRAGIPADAETPVLNVTVTEPGAAGFATVYPCGIEPPLASNVNFSAEQTIPNAVISKIGTNGDVCIFNSQPTHLIADVNGYFP